jgi:hypothetical protein
MRQRRPLPHQIQNIRKLIRFEAHVTPHLSENCVGLFIVVLYTVVEFDFVVVERGSLGGGGGVSRGSITQSQTK